MVDFLARATAKVCLRRTGRFEGKVKPGADGDDSGIYGPDEDRWDVDFRHHDVNQWPEDGPVWFASGDLAEIKLNEDQSDG